MSFNHHIDDIVQVVEGVGVAILVVGGLAVCVHAAVMYMLPSRRASSYRYFRLYLGRVIMLGLEVLIIADLTRTAIVDQTAESVAVLAAIVLVRITLSWSLAVEIDGVWPWKRGAAAGAAPSETEASGAL